MNEGRLDVEGADYAFGHTPMEGARTRDNRLAYRFAKRAFDIVFSAGTIVVLLVPGIILGAFVARDTGGSPLYTQRRLGKGGKEFTILKFRTMVADADDIEKYLDSEQLAQWHAERKVDSDPRITSLGRFLRKTSIDEFPQFLNVFVGQLSIVGPRAITRDELEWYSGEERRLLLSVPAGITGLWQTGPRNEYDYESGRRQRLELSYVRDASLLLDAKLFFRTFGAMVQETGR